MKHEGLICVQISVDVNVYLEMVRILSGMKKWKS